MQIGAFFVRIANGNPEVDNPDINISYPRKVFRFDIYHYYLKETDVLMFLLIFILFKIIHHAHKN